MKKHIKHGCALSAMVKVLPVFNGYTVDVRLREFRKGSSETGMEFIDFSSPEGDDLLEEYLGTLDKNSAEFRKISAYIFAKE